MVACARRVGRMSSAAVVVVVAAWAARPRRVGRLRWPYRPRRPRRLEFPMAPSRRASALRRPEARTSSRSSLPAPRSRHRSRRRFPSAGSYRPPRDRCSSRWARPRGRCARPRRMRELEVRSRLARDRLGAGARRHPRRLRGASSRRQGDPRHGRPARGSMQGAARFGHRDPGLVGRGPGLGRDCRRTRFNHRLVGSPAPRAMDHRSLRKTSILPRRVLSRGQRESRHHRSIPVGGRGRRARPFE